MTMERALAPSVPAPSIAFVGAYASGSGTGGIHVYRVDGLDGRLTRLQRVAPGMEASYLCLSPDGRVLYAVDERKTDGRGPVGRRAAVAAFRFDSGTATLTAINTRPAFGPFPTYIACDPRGRAVVTASHGSFEHVEHVVRRPDGFEVTYLYDHSTVAIYPIAPDGGLEGASHVEVLRGHGVDPSASPQAGGHPQASAHAHCAVFDPSGGYVLAADKGTDRVYVYAIGADARSLDRASIYRAPSGSAPRHLVFHPAGDLVLLVNELASTLSALRFDAAAGVLTHLCTIATTGAAWSGPNEPADVRVHPNGRFAYVNNRGEDTIAVVAVDSVTGGLERIAASPLARAAHPGVAARSLALDAAGDLLFVTDRPAGAIRAYRVDARAGTLDEAARTPIDEPAFIMLARVPTAPPPA